MSHHEMGVDTREDAAADYRNQRYHPANEDFPDPLFIREDEAKGTADIHRLALQTEKRELA